MQNPLISMETPRETAKKEDETAEVRLTISDYMDIFSDFDSRPLADRGFSEDFMFEAERAVMSKNSDSINFIILAPEKKRNIREEGIIRNRLKKYFAKHYEIMKKKKKKVVRKGAYFVLAGIILMLAATYLFFKFRDETFAASFFTILLEPASWFLFWEGLDLIIFDSKRASPNLSFYERMQIANIRFSSA
jgi:hypothetical protein